MARIEVTEEWARGLVDNAVFEQAAEWTDKVTGPHVDGLLVQDRDWLAARLAELAAADPALAARLLDAAEDADVLTGSLQGTGRSGHGDQPLPPHHGDRVHDVIGGDLGYR